MATTVRTTGIVYRRGGFSQKNFTPRPGIDEVARSGQEAGLSTSLRIARGERAQAVDLSLLPPKLRAFEDDPTIGGTTGHVTITPVNEDGRIDLQSLEDWAAARETDSVHLLTVQLMKSVVERDIRG